LGPPWRDDFDLITPKWNAEGVAAFINELNRAGLGQGLGISDLKKERGLNFISDLVELFTG